jgi:hypothetical protein
MLDQRMRHIVLAFSFHKGGGVVLRSEVSSSGNVLVLVW